MNLSDLFPQPRVREIADGIPALSLREVQLRIDAINAVMPEIARAVLEEAASQLEEQAHRARTDMFQYSTPTEGMMLMQEARFADAAALRQMAKEIEP